MKLRNVIPAFLAIAVTTSLAVTGCAPAFEPETDMTIEQTGVRANEIADLAESLIPAEAVIGVGNQFDESGPTSGMDVDPRGIYRSWGVSRTLILTAGSPNVEFFNTAVDELAAQGWKPYADERTTELAARLRNGAEPGFSLHMTTGEVDPSKPGQIVITVYGPVVETDGRPL